MCRLMCKEIDSLYVPRMHSIPPVSSSTILVTEAWCYNSSSVPVSPCLQAWAQGNQTLLSQMDHFSKLLQTTYMVGLQQKSRLQRPPFERPTSVVTNLGASSSLEARTLKTFQPFGTMYLFKNQSTHGGLGVGGCGVVLEKVTWKKGYVTWLSSWLSSVPVRLSMSYYKSKPDAQKYEKSPSDP